MIQSLQQSVQSVIADGRIGGPVFLRCMVQAHIEDAHIVKGMAALTALANMWMPSSPERLYALGSADATQATTTVQYAGGQTAILSINRIPDPQVALNRPESPKDLIGEASVDLILIGNKGVIYHETPVGRHRLMNAPLEFSGGEHLMGLMEQAMKTGKPVNL